MALWLDGLLPPPPLDVGLSVEEDEMDALVYRFTRDTLKGMYPLTDEDMRIASSLVRVAFRIVGELGDTNEMGYFVCQVGNFNLEHSEFVGRNSEAVMKRHEAKGGEQGE